MKLANNTFNQPVSSSFLVLYVCDPDRHFIVVCLKYFYAHPRCPADRSTASFPTELQSVSLQKSIVILTSSTYYPLHFPSSYSSFCFLIVLILHILCVFIIETSPSSCHCSPSPSPHILQILFHSFFSLSLPSPLSLPWCVHSRVCCGFFMIYQCFAWRLCFAHHFFLIWVVNRQSPVLVRTVCFAITMASIR